MYEPYVYALGNRLIMPIPAWSNPARAANWQTSAWEKTAAGRPETEAAASGVDREHL